MQQPCAAGALLIRRELKLQGSCTFDRCYTWANNLWGGLYKIHEKQPVHNSHNFLLYAPLRLGCKSALCKNWDFLFFSTGQDFIFTAHCDQSEKAFRISVTRWQHCCLMFGHLKLRKFAQRHKNCQNRFKFLTCTELTLQKLLKTFLILPKWRNFAKSDRTVQDGKH